VHTTGILVPLKDEAPVIPLPDVPLEPLIKEKHSFLKFGPRWAGIDILGHTKSKDESVLRFSLSEEFASETAQYRLHPALLDGAMGFLFSVSA
jgi:hypothetical protein